MRFTMLGGLAVLLLSLPLLADDKKEEKSEAKKDRKEQFADLKEAYNKQMGEFRDGMKNVKTQQQYIELMKEKQPKPKEYLPKIMALVEEDPKDELSFEMLTFAVNIGGPDSKKAIKFLSDAHAANPKMANVAKMFAQRAFPEVKPLLEKIYSSNENKEAKAFSAFGLANMAFELTDDTDKSPAERKTATQEAEKYFEILVKDFADVNLGKRTLGDTAKRYLFDVRNLQVGMKAPEAISENLEGKKEKLSDYKGKVVVLDIWATWCGPCRAMIPHEREMVKKLEDKPFVLISVSADAKKETLTEFLEKEKMPWNHWWAGNEQGLTQDWNVRFYPTIYVIDAKGVIRHKNIREKELEEAVEALIKEAEAK